MTLVRRTRIFLFWFFCLGISLFAWRFIPFGVEASMTGLAYHADLRPVAFYAHVGLAPVALALMPFQFLRGLRAGRPAVHRWLGRAYGLSVLLSGVGGLLLALRTEAGPVAATGFAALAILWIGTTATGILHAMRGRVVAHRVWMIRSAALTFAAVTLRVHLPILAMPLGFEAAYSLVAWAAWVPNLLVAEWILRGPALRRALAPA